MSEKNLGRVRSLNYVAFASDDQGADFALTPQADSTHVAFLESGEVLDPPVVSNFTGLWKKYVGKDADQYNLDDIDDGSNNVSVKKKTVTIGSADVSDLNSQPYNLLNAATDKIYILFAAAVKSTVKVDPGTAQNDIKLQLSNSANSNFIFASTLINASEGFPEDEAKQIQTNNSYITGDGIWALTDVAPVDWSAFEITLFYQEF